MKETTQKRVNTLPFVENSRKYKLMCSDRKQINGCPKLGVARWEGGMLKGFEEAFEGGGCVHCSEMCGNNFTDVCKCQILSNCTL